MTLLDIKNLSVNFALPGRTVNAVQNISLNIEEGQTVALVGESGSGKSCSYFLIRVPHIHKAVLPLRTPNCWEHGKTHCKKYGVATSP